jgi:high affinity Mn2+ porin
MKVAQLSLNGKQLAAVFRIKALRRLHCCALPVLCWGGAGALRRRPDHTFGFAGIVNGISGVHQAFLNAGGLGILVGDGVLPNPGHEKIIETYYSFPLFAWRMTLDYQLIINPAYNADRGPVSVIGTRLRAQF